MCQTRLLSEHIVRIGTRSYRQQMDVVAMQTYQLSRLVRLNRDLDAFYEFLYSQWQTITAADYKVFGKQLAIMLSTLKSLYQSLSKLPAYMGLSKEIERLGMNYSAIYEVNSDIVNFKVKKPKDDDLSSLLAQASQVSSTIAAQ